MHVDTLMIILLYQKETNPHSICSEYNRVVERYVIILMLSVIASCLHSVRDQMKIAEKIKQNLKILENMEK